MLSKSLDYSAMKKDPDTFRTRLQPRLAFFGVLFIGLMLTFGLLLRFSPEYLTQTTFDQQLKTSNLQDILIDPNLSESKLENQDLLIGIINHANKTTGNANKNNNGEKSRLSQSKEEGGGNNKKKNRRRTKVAIVADAGLNDASILVLNLIKQENVDMVLHQGDLDYVGNTKEFFRRINSILGPTFPYFITMGNYESKRGSGRAVAWEGYWQVQKERLKKIEGLNCPIVSRRVLGCDFMGVSFITSAIGVNASRMGLDVKELKAAQKALWGAETKQLSNGINAWRFCGWHLPMIDFQVGFREGVPWMSSKEMLEAYESCRIRGGVILTGHEHYYVRSYTIRKFGLKSSEVKYEKLTADVKGEAWSELINDVNHTRAEVLLVGPGLSFSIVSGLGGHSVSIPSAKRIFENPHLAVVHPRSLVTDVDPGGKFYYPEITGKMEETSTSSEKIRASVIPGVGYPFGVLFCSLAKSPSVDAKGICYFKTISGKIVDRFVIQRSRP